MSSFIVLAMTQKYYDVVTKDRYGNWADDHTGENEPRSRASCLRDIRAFQNGECGHEPEWVDAEYAIRDTRTGAIERIEKL